MVAGAAFAIESAQVPVLQEPRHKRMLYTAHLRLLEVTIPPGDTTLDHSHDYDIATVALEDAVSRTKVGNEAWGPARERGAGTLNLTEYTGAKGSHQIENVGKTPFRLVAVENVRDGGWTTPAPVAAPGTSLTRESRAFSMYTVELDDATPETAHTHEVPTVAVLVEGTVSYQGGGGVEPFELRQVGRWVFAPQGSAHTMRVADGGKARLIEFEAR